MARSGRPAILLGASVALLFFDLGSRVLGTNDEVRFPLLARDILTHGDWLLPSLNGEPYLNKPPLYAWLIALVSWPAGSVSQASAAVVSPLAALGVVGVTSWIGRRLFDADVGLAAGLVALTTHGVFTLARAPMPDMTLCLAFAAAMAAFVIAEFEGRRHALAAFYCLVGLAFWTKGPAGLLPLVVVVAYTVIAHRLRGLLRLGSAPGLALLGLGLTLWWIRGASAGFEKFALNVVMTDLVGWYLGDAHSRRSLLAPVAQPLEILLPWTVLLPIAIWTAVRSGPSRWPVGKVSPSAAPGHASTPARSDALRVRLVLVWAAVVWIVVAFSAQQRMRYYLPLVPPAALLIALWWRTLPRRRAATAFAGMWLSGTVLLAGWHVRVAVHANAATDLRAIARETRAVPAALYVVDAPELVLAFYLNRQVTALAPDRPLEEHVRAARDGYLIISDRLLPASANGLSRRRIAGGTIGGRDVAVLDRE